MSLPLRKNISFELPKSRPFLKWVGGKRQLMPDIARLLPREFNVYYEPFLGGGAVLMNFDFKRAVAGDINEELIHTYRVIKTDAASVILLLKKHSRFHNQGYYYNMRKLDPRNLNKVERAARLIYLNRTCYNGLYRVNSRGEFNVPLGSYKNPLICDEENLLLVQRKLKNIRLLAGNYRKIAAGAKQGDFVYFDPPYAPLSTSSSFVNYAKDGFSREDQAELCDFFKELTSRGVLCMLSNSSAPLIFRLYQGFHIERVKASRPVNSQPGGRGKIEELIITNY